jgi:hypothetical protein
MTSFVDSDRIDAERWLYLHEGQLLGARSREAADVVRDAGLVPQVSPYRSMASEVGAPVRTRVRLFVDGDDAVRSARSG